MLFINMVNHKKEEIDLSTKTCDYGNTESTYKGKETSDQKNSLHMQKLEKETMPHIPKDVYKCASQNLNARAAPTILLLRTWLRFHV
jgi:hypothetical protein